MDAFSYLSVLLSIILGLAMTQILTAAGRMIRARERVTLYAPPVIWATMLLVIDVQIWWAMFGYRTRTHWEFVEFMMVLLQTVSAYMLAAVVLPDEVPAEGVNLREYYERNSPWLFGFLITTVLVSILKELMLEGRLPVPLNLAFHVLLLATATAAIAIRRPWFHQALAVSGAIFFATYIALLFSKLAT